MIWFIVLMPIINKGVQNHAEADVTPKDGSDISSPVTHGLKQKLILTSLVSLGIWVVLIGLYVVFEILPNT